jgi:hypothetical protein
VRARRVCTFCRSPGSSEEDVFAKWIADALGGPGKFGFDLQTRQGRSKTNTRHLRLTSRAACAKCNSEWMSQFEETAAPLLTPMFRGQAVTLQTEAEKIRVARWIFKTALMVDRAHKPTNWTVPETHFRYVYEHHKPPPSATITLGLYVPAPTDRPWAASTNTAWASAQGTSGPKLDGYRVTFSVGHAIFETYAHVDPERDNLIFDRRITIGGNPAPDALRRLWPTEPTPHEWPPLGLPFTNAGLEFLADEEP